MAIVLLPEEKEDNVGDTFAASWNCRSRRNGVEVWNEVIL
jgi:hypothetical protein